MIHINRVAESDRGSYECEKWNDQSMERILAISEVHVVGE